MSYEVITVGELAFSLAKDRAAWRAAHRKRLAEYVDVKSYHPSMVYYLDLTDDGRKLVVRGLVHRDGFHELVDVLANASTFGATGRVDFETTEGDCHELLCKGGKSAFHDVEKSKLDRDVVSEIFDESARRANPEEAGGPDEAAKQLLTRARALKVPSDPKDFVKLFDREFAALWQELEHVRSHAARRELFKILGELGAQVRAARKAARSTTAKAAAARRKATARTAKSKSPKAPAPRSRKR